MEKSNLLQRPGGLGPMNAMQPLGGTGIQSPAAYAVTPEMIAVRRAAGMDNINRVMAQYSRDRGETVRAAVGPTNYQEGNIMPSMQATGPAGYQHRDPLVLPDRPADMTKADYLVKEQNSMNPDLRAKMQILTTLPPTKFLQRARRFDVADDSGLQNPRKSAHAKACWREDAQPW
jgi:hypothetical protein